MSGPRMMMVALAALGAVAFTAPAHATALGDEISVSSEVTIGADGSIHLSGTYRCTSSAGVAHQIRATVQQESVRLGIGAGNVVCDGAERPWEAGAPAAFVPAVHGGEAKATAELQEIDMAGLVPRSVSTVARDSRAVTLTDQR
ncbi:DUF6299 family protein [Kitasatospora sp. NPDC056181]|uniref:DUF6299 family protein n=1 Tax=Kitasatospora sp. NPDC056181 TaxID=3345737 RepID=UPI0035DCAF18